MSLANPESSPPVIDRMIGNSAQMLAVYQLTRQVAVTSTTVLITGETGTGKELIARALHELSPRATGPNQRTRRGPAPGAGRGYARARHI